MNTRPLNNPTIPIITLNWNGLSDTLECMEAVFQQSYQDFLVYLVDNGSKGDDAQILQEKFGTHPKVKLVLNDENLGFTKGNNVIMRQLIQEDFEYIALLNNDAFPHKDWLKNLVESAEQHQAGMVATKMVSYFNPQQLDNVGHKMLNTAEIIPIGHMEPVEDHLEVQENMGACAGAVLYSVSMLRDIGVFDEYFETGYEDAEIGVRANVLGYKTIFEPTAIVQHKISQSVNKIRDYEYVKKIQLNIFYAYFKLMPLGVLLINFPSFLFKYGSVLIIDILFFRWSFLKIMLDSIYTTITSERPTILASRRKFMQKHKPISSFKILKKMDFFLWFDIKRFVKFVLLRQKTTFEKYNDSPSEERGARGEERV